ncbi:MAG: hypothetical protein Q8L48_29800 [Archangium sp.]|nr:hypothetical protein [Archangium sp.]
MARVSLRGVVTRVGERVLVGPVLDLAAQLAFYVVLAMAPFLVVLTSLAGFLSRPRRAAKGDTPAPASRSRFTSGRVNTASSS